MFAEINDRGKIEGHIVLATDPRGRAAEDFSTKENSLCDLASQHEADERPVAIARARVDVVAPAAIGRPLAPLLAPTLLQPKWQEGSDMAAAQLEITP